MNYFNNKLKTVLFDLDGVILDTETQYSDYWNLAGLKYIGVKEFGNKIKGQSLTSILKKHFSCDNLVNDVALNFPNNNIFDVITKEVDLFESKMRMPYIAGAFEFISELKKTNVNLAIVTSSSSNKMKAVKQQHPELFSIFDRVFTAEEYKRGKPSPDCFLLGASYFKSKPVECVVFEDSVFGLQAARAANMSVIGLETTNPAKDIKPLCDLLLDNFLNYSADNLFSFFDENKCK